MKKLVLIFILGGSLMACNNTSESTEEKKDSLDSIANEKKEAIDSTAERKKDIIDSAAKKTKDSLDRIDSLKGKKTRRDTLPVNMK